MVGQPKCLFRVLKRLLVTRPKCVFQGGVVDGRTVFMGIIACRLDLTLYCSTVIFTYIHIVSFPAREHAGSSATKRENFART